MHIIINQGYKRYIMSVELILKEDVCEQYKVYAAENPNKYLLLENNRPLIRERYKLKKRRIDWKQIAGKTVSVKTREEIIRKIETPDIEQPLIIPKPTKNRKKGYNPGPTLQERMNKR
jgi:hypothetical protein